MIRLFLLRHGNTFEAGQTSVQIGRRTDMPLTSRGREQAQEFADYLLRHNIAPRAVYCGNLQRQVETARIISQASRVQLHLGEPALDEIDYGEWEGLSEEEIRERWPVEYEAWVEEGIWPGRVFAQEQEVRLQQWREFLAKCVEAAEPVVVAVTSNGALRLLLSLLGQAEVERLKGQGLKVKTGHFCELEVSEAGIVVRAWNRGRERTQN